MPIQVKVKHCVECKGKGYVLNEFNEVNAIPAIYSCSYCGGTGHLVAVTEDE